MAQMYRNPIGYGINTCHAPLMLRKDLLEHLAFLKSYCGFTYARCHGVLDDSIHVASRAGDGSQPHPVWATVDGKLQEQPEAQGKLRFHFQQAHKVFGNLLEIGYTPLVELSFLPSVMAANPEPRIAYYRSCGSNPTSYAEWGDLIEALGRSLVNRFGLREVSRWRFAVWNEPNGGFWFPAGEKFAEYMKLYEAAARALKRVSGRLEVGGPATMVAGWAPPGTEMAKDSPTGSGGPLDGRGWIESFIEFCQAGKIPLDFIETHLYPFDEYEICKKQTRDLFGPHDFYPKTIRKINEMVARMLPGMDVIWGEWSSNHRPGKKGLPFWDPDLSRIAFTENLQYDTPFAGAYSAKIAGTFLEGQKMCWWVGTDVYEEWGWRHQPYHCGYGLMNIHGIPKPSAHAHHLAHLMDGGKILARFSRDGQGFLSVRKGGRNMVLFWNWIHPELPDIRYALDLQGVGFKVGKGAKLLLADDRHAHGRAVWDRLGRPAELSRPQEATIRRGSELREQPLPAKAIKEQKLVIEPNGFGLVAQAF